MHTQDQVLQEWRILLQQEARRKHIPEGLIPVYVNERVNYFCSTTPLTEDEEIFLRTKFPRSPHASFETHKEKIAVVLCSLNPILEWKSSLKLLNQSFKTEIMSLICETQHPRKKMLHKVRVYDLFVLFKETYFL